MGLWLRVTEFAGVLAFRPTYKIGLMLALCSEPFDYVSIALRAGEHKKPEFMARQRFGQVPLLIDKGNGRKLCQSGRSSNIWRTCWGSSQATPSRSGSRPAKGYSGISTGSRRTSTGRAA